MARAAAGSKPSMNPGRSALALPSEGAPLAFGELAAPGVAALAALAAPLPSLALPGRVTVAPARAPPAGAAAAAPPLGLAAADAAAEAAGAASGDGDACVKVGVAGVAAAAATGAAAVGVGAAATGGATGVAGVTAAADGAGVAATGVGAARTGSAAAVFGGSTAFVGSGAALGGSLLTGSVVASFGASTFGASAFGNSTGGGAGNGLGTSTTGVATGSGKLSAGIACNGCGIATGDCFSMRIGGVAAAGSVNFDSVGGGVGGGDGVSTNSTRVVLTGGGSTATVVRIGLAMLGCGSRVGTLRDVDGGNSALFETTGAGGLGASAIRARSVVVESLLGSAGALKPKLLPPNSMFANSKCKVIDPTTVHIRPARARTFMSCIRLRKLVMGSVSACMFQECISKRATDNRKC
ncbi:MAG: hypothetical protein EAZ30_04070 [Betaproteobacteria bacterium]|nr:MAG: hypothetical protein EAZ30_04070 [Betaproteobacteria bacterium]